MLYEMQIVEMSCSDLPSERGRGFAIDRASQTREQQLHTRSLAACIFLPYLTHNDAPPSHAAMKASCLLRVAMRRDSGSMGGKGRGGLARLATCQQPAPG